MPDVFDQLWDAPSKDRFDELWDTTEPSRPAEFSPEEWKSAQAAMEKPDWQSAEANYNRIYRPPAEPEAPLRQQVVEAITGQGEEAMASPLSLPQKALSLVPRANPQDLETLGLPPKASQAIAGGINVGRGVAEGLVSPLGLATLGAGALPSIAQKGLSAGFIADMASHVPEQAQRAGTASVEGDLQEKVEAFGNLGVTPLMASAIGLHGFRPAPLIPPEVQATISRAENLGLKKSAEAAARKSVPIEVEAKVEEVPDARSQPETTTVPEPEIRPRVGEETPLRQQGEPAEIQTPAEVRPVEEVVKRITELTDADAGNLKQRGAVEEGMKLTPEDVPALEKARDDAMARMVAALESGDEVMGKAEMGRNIWFSGAIEGANRKGPNYDYMLKENPAIGDSGAARKQAPGNADPVLEKAIQDQASAPVPEAVAEAPQVSAQVEPSKIASLESWADRVITEGQKRVATGLDPELLAAYAVKGSLVLARGVKRGTEWSAEMVKAFGKEIEPHLNTILAHIDSKDFASKINTLGESEKMRKSAERATTSPQIPEPVQEQIKTAPESRYTQQSMARVEEAVAGLSEPELAAVPRDSDLYTAARLEQAKRLFDAGKNDEGYKVFVELEKEGTRLGQLINQFKLLAGNKPENVVAVVNQTLKRAGKDLLTPEQSTKLLDTAKKSKAADGELNAATDAWEKDPTDANAAAAESKLDAANVEALKLQEFVNKMQPRTTPATLKSILQGNLLTPISEVANLVGNVSFLPFRAATRGGAAAIDIIDAALRGKPREVSAAPVSGTAQAAKGAVRGLKQVPAILAKGTGNVIKGETRAGLHPIRAWIDQFAKNPERPTVGGKLTLSDRLNLALEGTFGVPAEIMLRGLGAGDAPFRQAAEARVIAEQLRLKKVPAAQHDFAQKFPELFFDRATMEQVRNDAAAAIFQGKSSSLDTINRFIRNNWLTQRGVHPDWIDLAVATVAPYKLTPWKITGEILSYNPIVALARGAWEAKKGNTREAKINASKFVVGSMLTGASYWLYSKGLLAPSMDDKDEAQKARLLAGQVMPPNHINVSGLKRALKGEDSKFKPGDETMDVFRGGGLAGAMMYLVANIGRDFERKPEAAQGDMLGSVLRQSTLEQVKFAMNQSYLSGIEGFLTAIKDGNADNFLRQWANTVTSIPLPNSLATLSRATREYKPDFSADKFSQQIENVVRNRLGFAGLDDYLPLKRGLWGEPLRETPKGRDALFYHFFDISKNQQVTDDPVPLELYRLWRQTGDTRVIPPLPTKNFTMANKTYILSPEQLSQYSELVGQQRREITESIVTNPNFQAMPDESKIKLLDRVYREGQERGKVLFWSQNPQLQPKATRAGFR